MYRTIDSQTWPRREHYLFFREYDNPFFNICSEVDVTELSHHIKESGQSFFLASLFLSLKVANGLESFRLRIHGDDVVVFDEIHAGSTIMNDNETFSFCYFPRHDRFCDFGTSAERVLRENRDRKGIFDPKDHHDDLIHYSVVPWISFTSISHARRFGREDSIPKIVFGKFTDRSGRLMMPISIEVHHSLMDALHVSRYLELFQQSLTKPELLY